MASVASDGCKVRECGLTLKLLHTKQSRSESHWKVIESFFNSSVPKTARRDANQMAVLAGVSSTAFFAPRIISSSSANARVLSYDLRTDT